MPDVNGVIAHQNTSVADGDALPAKRKRSESISKSQENDTPSHKQRKDDRSSKLFSQKADLLQILERYANMVAK